MRLIFSGIGLLITWSLFVTAHLYFLQLFLYWHFAWLDIVMHILGGMLLVASWYELRRRGVFKSLVNKVWFNPILFLVAAMLLWEVFRYMTDNLVRESYKLDTLFDLLLHSPSELLFTIYFLVVGGRETFWIDTTLDLLFGLIGGLVSFWLFRSRTIGR